MPINEPSWRKPVGILLILAIIIVWAVLVVTLAGFFVEGAPFLIQAIFYLIAGIIWIVPLRPILIWMEAGKWRE